MGSRMQEQDGASPAKIFVGGLPKETTLEQFREHFGKYGNVVDIVIMKDRETHKPRGFGFVTYEDPSAVDQVIEDTHVIHGKTVEIKRTIPKGAAPLKDFKTKKIFVGGLPTTLTEDEFKDFFSQFGKVVDQEIIRDHATNKSRGFGFLVFEKEKCVDDLLAKKGNMIDLAGTQVEIKKAEPKRPSNPPSAFGSEPRTRHHGDSFGSFGGSYRGRGGGSYGPPPFRSSSGFGPRPGGYGDYGGYGAGVGEYGGGYGGYGGSLGDYRGESSLGYSGRMGPYGGGFGGGYGSSGFGSYGRGDDAGGYGGSSYGGSSYGGSSYGGNYDSPGAGAGAGGYGSGGLYGGRGGGYGSGAGRYHPYGR